MTMQLHKVFSEKFHPLHSHQRVAAEAVLRTIAA